MPGICFCTKPKTVTVNTVCTFTSDFPVVKTRQKEEKMLGSIDLTLLSFIPARC